MTEEEIIKNYKSGDHFKADIRSDKEIIGKIYIGKWHSGDGLDRVFLMQDVAHGSVPFTGTEFGFSKSYIWDYRVSNMTIIPHQKNEVIDNYSIY
jgi:hypothetical protein